MDVYLIIVLAIIIPYHMPYLLLEQNYVGPTLLTDTKGGGQVFVT